MFDRLEDDITIVSSHGEPCPVCGAAGTNCRGDSQYDGVMSAVPVKPFDDPEATFIVPDRVFTESVVGTRKVKKLLHAKGARIRPDEARRLGLLK